MFMLSPRLRRDVFSSYRARPMPVLAPNSPHAPSTRCFLSTPSLMKMAEWMPPSSLPVFRNTHRCSQNGVVRAIYILIINKLLIHLVLKMVLSVCDFCPRSQYFVHEFLYVLQKGCFTAPAVALRMHRELKPFARTRVATTC